MDNRKKKKDYRKTFRSERPPLARKKDVLNIVRKEEIIGMRLNKYIAHCGVCSRRSAAEKIKAGEVTVNGETVHEPYYQIQKNDRVQLNGKFLKPETRKVYILINKPKNVITTLRDERGRTTVMDIIGDENISERIFPVGRLDKDTTGLLLLTNDGQMAKKLSHPSHQIKKTYRAVLDKSLEEKDLEMIRKGLLLDDGKANVDAVNLLDRGDRNEVEITLHIGKNRIVRRIFEFLGYHVVKLDRVYYAGLTKKDLPRGKFRFLTEREIVMLKHFTSAGKNIKSIVPPRK